MILRLDPDLEGQPTPNLSANSVIAGMPLLFGHVKEEKAWKDWAIIVRDHMVEHTYGLALALLESGVPAEWLRVYDKGDSTLWQSQLSERFEDLGIWGGLLDNTAINAPEDYRETLQEVKDDLEQFIQTAHNADRHVLVIDDGGLIAQGYAHPDHKIRVDAAIELTISGLDRIAVAGELAVPVLDLARSQVKQSLGYREIAHSCVQRLFDMVGSEKVIGQKVLVLGYGTLGSLFASELRSSGTRISVFDPDYLRLAMAAESGFTTYESLTEALVRDAPFVIVGTSGHLALTTEHFDYLPDEVILAPFATKDFSALHQSQEVRLTRRISGWGDEYRLPSGFYCTVLGNGRSLNLFRADSISPSGYDAYRTAVYLAARDLARREITAPGLHAEGANEIVRRESLYKSYYQTYLGPNAVRPSQPKRAQLHGVACVIGLGHAGRLHASALREAGFLVLCVDPRLEGEAIWGSIASIPAHRRKEVSRWHICTPTQSHLTTLEEVMAIDPHANIVLEKPAVPPSSVERLLEILSDPHNRVTITDQYSTSAITGALKKRVRDRTMSAEAPIRIYVEFSKDRRDDEARGRFIDAEHGALGYEWTHMLAIVRTVAPNLYESYLRDDGSTREIRSVTNELDLPVSVSESYQSGDSELTMYTSSVSTTNAHLPDGLPPRCIDYLSFEGRRRVCIVWLRDSVVVARFAPGGAATGADKGEIIEIDLATSEVIHTQAFTDMPLHNFLASSYDGQAATASLEGLKAMHRTASQCASAGARLRTP